MCKKKTRYHDQLSLRLISIVLGCLVILVFGFSGCTETKNSNETPVISGQPNTMFPLPPVKPLGSMGWDLGNGRRNQFSDFKGKVLVLDFYATWCEPCRASVPHLVQLQETYASQGLQIVGLNVGGPDDVNYVSEFAREFKIQYPLGIPEDVLSQFLLSNDTSIPQTFVFDRKGLLVKRFIGYSPTTETELDATIKTALDSPAG